MLEYIFKVVLGVVTNFKALELWQQFFYCLYLISGLFGPIATMKQGLKYRMGSGGTGDTCVKNMMVQASWRFPPLLYSFLCFEYLVLPLFLSVFLDICARGYVIHSALHAKKRYFAGPDACDNTEGSRQMRLVNYYGYAHDIAVTELADGWQAVYHTIDEGGTLGREFITCKSFPDLEYELTALIGNESWDGVERRGTLFSRA